MDIKTQLAEIFAELDKPKGEIKTARVGAKLAALVADLSEDITELPDDVLAPLNNDMRKMALMGFALLAGEFIGIA